MRAEVARLRSETPSSPIERQQAMSTPECVGHEWSIHAIEVAPAGVWTEEICQVCGDERVTRASAAVTAAALSATALAAAS